MANEFNLSENIVDDLRDGGQLGLRIEDVKEFIKRLKEEVNKSIPILHGYNPIVLGHIDKLAGDELV